MSESTAQTMLNVKRSGDTAFLVDLGSLEAAMALRAELENDPPAGVADIVAAATTVMVVAESPRFVDRLIGHVTSLDPDASPGVNGRRIDVPVYYEGDDLVSLSEMLGQTPESLIMWHSSATWIAAFTGFAPGFVYLVSDAGPSIPRRQSPRTAVPAGSVGLADAYSAVYPRSSPGGWQLIGRTDVVLFDEAMTDPALIHPGDQVRFSRVGPPAVSAAPPPRPARPHARPREGWDATITHPGVSATIQDLGRPGHADLGVGPAGGMDRAAMTRANVLVGNAKGEATVEALGIGFAVRAITDQVVAVTGAASRVSVCSEPPTPDSQRNPPVNTAFALVAGEVLTIERADHGTWSYVAFRGGIETDLVLGSRSRDSHSRLGPEPLTARSGLRIRQATVSAVVQEAYLRAFTAIAAWRRTPSRWR